MVLMMIGPLAGRPPLRPTARNSDILKVISIIFFGYKCRAGAVIRVTLQISFRRH